MELLTRAESTGMFAIHRRTLAAIGTVILGAVSVFAGSQAFANDGDILRVYMNSARILKLDRPVSKVIVGNSDVADATVADARTIVVTGRSYGSTNIVLLDADGNALLDERIVVSIDESNTVRLFKSTNRTVLSCTPNCEQHAQGSGTP